MPLIVFSISKASRRDDIQLPYSSSTEQVTSSHLPLPLAQSATYHKQYPTQPIFHSMRGGAAGVHWYKTMRKKKIHYSNAQGSPTAPCDPQSHNMQAPIMKRKPLHRPHRPIIRSPHFASTASHDNVEDASSGIVTTPLFNDSKIPESPAGCQYVHSHKQKSRLRITTPRNESGTVIMLRHFRLSLRGSARRVCAF